VRRRLERLRLEMVFAAVRWVEWVVLLLPVAVVLAYSPSRIPDERHLTLLNSDGQATNVTVPVVVASFGRSLNETVTFNLMLPPTDDDSFLCTLPESVKRGRTEEIGFDRYPISALYVADRNCVAQRKASVMQQIKDIVPAFKYLIIYADETANEQNNRRPPFDPADYTTIGADGATLFDDIGVLFVPIQHAFVIEAALLVIRKTSRSISPHFLDPTSVDWIFKFRLERARPDRDNGWEDPYDDRDGGDGFYPESEDYTMLRGFLFGLLIAAPLCRAAYLWYAGGGRFHWRRNDHGRIVGIQHVPPIPYWLALARPLSSRDVKDTLTEEQFAKLPEFKYQTPDHSSTESSTSSNEDTLFQTASCNAAQTDPEVFHGHTHESRPHDEPKLTEESVVVAVGDDLKVQVVHDSLSSRDGTAAPREKDLERQMSPNVSMEQELEDDDDLRLFNDAVHNPTEAANTCLGSNGLQPRSSEVSPLDRAAADEPSHYQLCSETVSSADPLAASLSAPQSETPALPCSPPISSDTATTNTKSTLIESRAACTTCAICIEDFVVGEVLILLPRCQHAFHRDCIHPWLLERQGCCPTCKAAALPDESEGTSDNASS
jgi:Ring finger domain